MDVFYVIVSALGIFMSGGVQVQSIDFVTSGDNLYYGNETAIFFSLAECENRLKEIIEENSRANSSQNIRIVSGKMMETISTDDWFQVNMCQQIKRKKGISDEF